MKNLCIFLLFLIPLFVLTTDCKKDDPQPVAEPIPNPLPVEVINGRITDPRNGQTYRVVEISNRYWMAENLNYETEDSWWYNNDPAMGKIYGRLFTWDAGMKACPPGWRLPTDEEWKAMVRYFDSEFDGKWPGSEIAYDALIDGGSSGFDALLGGNRLSNGDFNPLGEYGFYWSDTEKNAGEAWVYYFYSYYGKLSRSHSYKSYGFSCRCIQDLN